MRRSLFVAGLCACVLVLVLGASSPASAQSVDDPRANDSTGNETNDETTELANQLGALKIHSYSYDGDAQEMRITATWTGRAPTTATLTELIELDSGGSTQISFKKIRLLPDEKTEFTVGARERSGGTAAVLISTPESVQNNSAVVLQAGSPSERDPVPFNMAAGAVAAAAGLAVLVSIALVVRKKYAEEGGKERIA